MSRDTLLWIVAGLLIIAGLGTGAYIMARGIRNNNPGNIRHGSSQWLGMSTVQSDDEYVQFDDAVYGIRAMAKLLQNYASRYRLNTIAEIIDRWAPPNENITHKYIEHVAQIVGASPDQEIDLDAAMLPLVKAIITHENGYNPYTDAQINAGIQLV